MEILQSGTMPSNESEQNGNTEYSVVLKDLQSLLRKSIGEEVIVVDYVTSALVSKGENYGSTIRKVDAVIRRSKGSPEEKLPLVAKMIPTTNFQRKHFNHTASFSKEMFFFETLIPGYEQLQKEAGVCEDDLLKILPKYYGGRLTMNEIAPDVADNDVVLLMENLKVREYYTVSRYYGMDYSHAMEAVKALAKFHALGMAVKVKNPGLFDAAKKCFDVKYDSYSEGVSETIDRLVDIVCKNPVVAKYQEKIKSNMEENNWQVWLWPIEQVEPWMTIIHGDFWVNNILFHQTNGNLDDVKFIDFQLAKIGSPQTDLPYFLCGNLSDEVMENHFDDLLDAYYSTLIETLHATGVDTTALSRESFDQHLQKVARSELFHCVMAIKFFTHKEGDEFNFDDINSSLLISDANEIFVHRATMVALKFIEKNWL